MRDFVFLPEMSDQLFQTLSVGRRKKCAILISLPVVFYQLRKVLLEEGKKDCGGTGLQEKWVGETFVTRHASSCPSWTGQITKDFTALALSYLLQRPKKSLSQKITNSLSMMLRG